MKGHEHRAVGHAAAEARQYDTSALPSACLCMVLDAFGRVSIEEEVVAIGRSRVDPGAHR